MRLIAIIEAATITGPAKNLLDFVRAARRLGIPMEPTIATFRRSGAQSGEFEERVRGEGIRIVAIEESGSFDRRVIGQLRSVVREIRPDVIQTHAVKSHFLAALASAGRDQPWLAFHHGYTQTDFKMLVYNQLDRWSLRRPAGIVTVSNSFKQQLVDRGVRPDRVRVLQNAVDPDWVTRVQQLEKYKTKQELGLEGCQVLLCIGRMSLEKAHADLIEAFARLRSENPLLKLVLVGDGPERRKLEQMSCEGVVFTGQQRDVTRYFAAADVVVLPSLSEGSPNVLLEAMACGVACVATEVGGVPEIVAHEREALLVPARQPEKLAAAIRRVLTDPALRSDLIEHALAAIRLRHSPAIRAQKLMRIYQETQAAFGKTRGASI